jgi:hypothetical protein
LSYLQVQQWVEGVCKEERMSANRTRRDRFDRRKIAAGLGVSVVIHLGLIAWVGVGMGPSEESVDASPLANAAPVEETTLEVIRIAATQPVPAEAVATAAASASASPAASRAVTGGATMARLFNGAEFVLATDYSAVRATGATSTGSLDHVDGVSTEGIWDEFDEWATGLVNRHVPGTGNSADGWFAALQGAAQPACGPPILINR